VSEACDKCGADISWQGESHTNCEQVVLLRAACEAAYKRFADRPRDAQWEYDAELREQLAEALKLPRYMRYE